MEAINKNQTRLSMYSVKLYQHRAEKRTQHKKLAEFLKNSDPCEFDDDGYGSWCFSKIGPSRGPGVEPCEICIASKKIHDEFLRESKEAERYLRKILNYGKKNQGYVKSGDM